MLSDTLSLGECDMHTYCVNVTCTHTQFGFGCRHSGTNQGWHRPVVRGEGSRLKSHALNRALRSGGGCPQTGGAVQQRFPLEFEPKTRHGIPEAVASKSMAMSCHKRYTKHSGWSVYAGTAHHRNPHIPVRPRCTPTAAPTVYYLVLPHDSSSILCQHHDSTTFFPRVGVTPDGGAVHRSV